MPITYTISRDERLIRAYATGVIRADDLHPFLDALLADPDLGPGLRGLYDASDAAPDITVLQLAEIATRVLQTGPAGRESLVPAGLAFVEAAFRELSPTIKISRLASDGKRVGAGAELLRVEGSARATLSAERVALNFLQRLGGEI